MDTADVVIAGGGIVGLSCALELAVRGLRVVVFDSGPAMTGASWAAAGMLAARDPDHPAALRAISEESAALYPEYLAAVTGLSGRPVPFRTDRTLQVLRPDDSPAHLSSNSGGGACGLSGAEAGALAPGINTTRCSFVVLPERSLDPRDLCAALPAATRAAGVELVENAPVASVRAGSAGSVEVRARDRLTAAGAFVNCCGAWAAGVGGSGAAVAVRPSKGQMAVVEIPRPGDLHVVLRSPDVYLVPRGDGRVVVGATVEDAGFDTTLRDDAEAHLLRAAAELWPPVAEGRVTERWAGLRPATADGLPLIGAAGAPGCFVSTGHFRNGILLAPATARAIAALITGEDPKVDLRPFAPERLWAAPVM